MPARIRISERGIWRGKDRERFEERVVKNFPNTLKKTVNPQM